MTNVFSVLKKKLTRREKKGKPVPVPVVPAEKPIKAVTYNRCDGHVEGGLIQAGVIHETKPPLQQTPKAAYWDQEAKVYKGANYLVQSQDAARRLADERRRLERDRDGYGGDQYDISMSVFERSMVAPVEVFYEEPERHSKAPESPSGYDYPRETVSSVYGDDRGQYGGSSISSESPTTRR